MPEVILVTGGAGFIGSNFLRHLLEERPGMQAVNLDALTYAGSAGTLADLITNENHTFVEGDIGDRELVAGLLSKHEPSAVINFAAETHVDRSIGSPERFVRTNIVGTFNLLDSTLDYWRKLDSEPQRRFRFVQISTDEVYGSTEAGCFTERSSYAPNSPYAASKASGDHLARAYHRTYGLPTLTIHPSNNYGPYQYPEKLIPLMTLHALDGRDLPVYADGANVRDWICVDDCCWAILNALEQGRAGECYNVGARNQLSNLEVVRSICKHLETLIPASQNPRLQERGVQAYVDLIRFVKDRPGHDRRYAVDPSKIERDLGWKPLESFETGLVKTVRWYFQNRKWCEQVRDDTYWEWLNSNYSDRRRVSGEGDHIGRRVRDATVPAHAGNL